MVTRVVDDAGTVLAEWWLLTNVDTTPALLAGLERLLAIDALMPIVNLDEILDLAMCQLPRLCPDRSG